MNQAESTTSVVHFSISGDFITQHARDLVREGQWRKGYDFLMDSLHGMEASLALDILAGSKKLEGVNDLEIAPDNASGEVSSWLAYQFRHCFTWQNRIWRPYAVVTAYGQEDWQLARDIHAGRDALMTRNPLWARAERELSEAPSIKSFNPWDHDEELRLRPAYYAEQRERDIMFRAQLGPGQYAAVLCELVEQERPLWLTLPRDATGAHTAARQAHEAGALRDRYQELFGDEVELARATPEAREADAADDDGGAGAALAQQTREERNEALRRELAEDEARNAAEDAAYQRTLGILRAQIAHFADHDEAHGWLELSAYDTKAGRQVTLRVPHRAFICAALSRARAWHLMPEYSPRCPSGLKMCNDDRYHSDAWVGAAQDPDEAYNDDLPEQRLFMDQLYELQRKHLSFSFDVLARGAQSYFYGQVIHDPALAHADAILVLERASPEFAPAALKCKAVVVETGSKLAHLVVVSREAQVPVVRLANARTLFPAGRRLTLSFEDGTLELSNI